MRITPNRHGSYGQRLVVIPGELAHNDAVNSSERGDHCDVTLLPVLVLNCAKEVRVRRITAWSCTLPSNQYVARSQARG